MFGWVKQKINSLSQKILQHEIERMQKENAELRAQIEEETGQPVQFSEEEQERLERARGE